MPGRYSQVLMVSIALCASSAVADNPIECVDPDIVNTLLGMPGQGQVDISRSLPESFPAIDVPAEMLSFFNQQLADQEWNQEGSWIGLITSGSAWHSADEERSGLLSIIDQGEGSFKLVFQTTERARSSSTTAIGIGSR